MIHILPIELIIYQILPNLSFKDIYNLEKAFPQFSKTFYRDPSVIPIKLKSLPKFKGGIMYLSCCFCESMKGVVSIIDKIMYSYPGAYLPFCPDCNEWVEEAHKAHLKRCNIIPVTICDSKVQFTVPGRAKEETWEIGAVIHDNGVIYVRFTYLHLLKTITLDKFYAYYPEVTLEPCWEQNEYYSFREIEDINRLLTSKLLK